MSEALYVRFQGTERSPRGHFPGVFGLANGLAREGRLSEEQHRFWRAGNDWYDAHYTNPSDVDPSVYDPAVNPGAVAWFKVTAVELIDRVDGYLTLLAEHRVPCERVESADPGTIVYEDADQVVVVPHPRSNESPTATTLDNSRTPQG
ncbi:hypothetical protein OG413_33490 [Streptomyces sp. NBC_01433]|uniref:hypothetical protein n=1 Tax=Streptomyces sp. NBC_01433 TaxID=2903864 RepID=UPI00225AEFC9|nr:hypothetical protein [Streptomyces sp. NBC_01433]MCX4680135.1 hypothetical protein [Streptomyces sp. NBC_01433]